MTIYLVEVYTPASSAGRSGRQAPREAAAASASSTRVRHVRSFFVPEDETCLHFFEGPSAEAVSEAVMRVGLTPTRIVAAIDWSRPTAAARRDDPTTRRWEGGAVKHVAAAEVKARAADQEAPPERGAQER